MDYGLFLKIANTGNNIADGFECPIQAAVKLLKFYTSMTGKELFGNPLYEYNEMAMPDEPILDSSAMYCGISNKRLEKDKPKPIIKFIPGLSRIISKFGNKNIYICGWDILEDDLRVLERNLKRLSFQPLDYEKFKIIDIKKLSELLLPVKEVGAYGIDAVTYHLSKELNLEYGILGSYRPKRHYKEFCSTLVDQSIYVCWKLARNAGFSNLDDIYTFMQQPHKLEVLPFGKHKGELIADVFVKDNEYLCWLHSCKDIMSKNKDLKYTLDSILV